MTTQPPPESAEPAPVVIKTNCWCVRCDTRTWDRTMILCPSCGNKRCPRAEWHGFVCSGSNETGQVGVPAPVATDTQAQPATPAPAGDAEVSHEQARKCVELLSGGTWSLSAARKLGAYVDQCEARQQQAEREVVERWKGANGYNDLLQAYGAAIDERDRYRDKKRELEQREVSLRDDIAELSRKLEAAERDKEDFRIGSRAEAERCDQLLAERNRARNETIAALEKLEAAKRERGALRSLIQEFADHCADSGWHNISAELLRRRDELCDRPAPPDQASPAKPLTRDDVKAIARAVVAELAEQTFERLKVECFPATQMKYLAEAAKEESGGD